jgi:hypothetical protein
LYCRQKYASEKFTVPYHSEKFTVPYHSWQETEGNDPNLKIANLRYFIIFGNTVQRFGECADD